MRLQFAPMQEYLWNPSQWQGSRKVQKMNWAERGLYRELMDECYLHGSIPSTSEGIADMLGEDPEVITPLWSRVSRCFDVDPDEPGRLISPFIEEVRIAQDAKRKVRSEMGRIGNEKRWANHSEDRKSDKSDRKSDNENPAATKNVANDREEGGRERVKEVPPLAPKGAAEDAAGFLPMPKDPEPQRKRKGKWESEDIRPENAEYLQKVYERIPTEHPYTKEPIHKGPYATAARAFQAIIDAGEATARELMAVGTLYYRAESLGPEWADWANRVWDTRPKAMMHVSTLYGPEKRPYRQLLPVARDLIAKKEQAQSHADMPVAS